jgi:hypothetical protein
MPKKVITQQKPISKPIKQQSRYTEYKKPDKKTRLPKNNSFKLSRENVMAQIPGQTQLKMAEYSESRTISEDLEIDVNYQ